MLKKSPIISRTKPTKWKIKPTRAKKSIAKWLSKNDNEKDNLNYQARENL